MTVRFELTTRLAELAGFGDQTLDLDGSPTLGDALDELKTRFVRHDDLAPGGRLHPSILVVVDGEARVNGERALPLAGGETIRLMLPVAGG